MVNTTNLGKATAWAVVCSALIIPYFVGWAFIINALI